MESKARFVELTRQVLEAAPATESRFRET
jgi:hypothetical protein